MSEQIILAPLNTGELRSQINCLEHLFSMSKSEHFSKFFIFESLCSNKTVFDIAKLSGSSFEDGTLSVDGSDAPLPGLGNSFALWVSSKDDDEDELVSKLSIENPLFGSIFTEKNAICQIKEQLVPSLFRKRNTELLIRTF